MFGITLVRYFWACWAFSQEGSLIWSTMMTRMFGFDSGVGTGAESGNGAPAAAAVALARNVRRVTSSWNGKKGPSLQVSDTQQG